jgi:copper chaperone CopZ
VQSALESVKCVKQAQVSYEKKEAVVKFDSAQCKVDDLIKAVREARGTSSFKAKLKKRETGGERQ